MNPHTFYLIKGIIALVTTVFVVVHMNLSWGKFDRDVNGVRTGISQRMRYLSWFLFIVLVAAASRDQIEQGVAIERRNAAALFVVVFAAITAVVSIKEARDNRTRRH